MFGPVLRGQKVTLRPPIDGDAQRFIDWFADLTVTRYLGSPFPLSLAAEEDALKRLGESKNEVFWVIEAEGRSIGGNGIHRIDWINGNAVTGIMIGDPSCWRKGYASEAMALRTRYAFRELNLHKLKSETFAENAGSWRSLEKSGYRRVGEAREEFWREGAWHDKYEWEVLRSDWERQQQASKTQI